MLQLFQKKAEDARNDKILKGGENCHFKFSKGLQGCSHGSRDPTPFCKPFFNQTTYNRWRKCHDDILAIVKRPFFKTFFFQSKTRRGGRHDNLVSTLNLKQCDLPFEKPGYAYAYSSNYGLC